VPLQFGGDIVDGGGVCFLFDDWDFLSGLVEWLVFIATLYPNVEIPPNAPLVFARKKPEMLEITD
jgi:hypothetical protein